jgi:uncharacterized membrane protein
MEYIKNQDESVVSVALEEDRVNSRWLLSLLAIVILLGIGFRFFQLDYKIYWHDETYTSIRASGYTTKQINNELFQNRIVSSPQLQQYQRIKPGTTAVDTISSLIVEDPQHPPLYFLLARFWMQQFGSSITASRSLAAILSLLSLPLIYVLAQELFASNLTALLATALLALSPFDISFAQTARQYSLLTVTVIGSSWLLLRAMRLKSWKNWVLYTLLSTLGLYTHPFFGLTIIAQGVFMIFCWPLVDNLKSQIRIINIRFFLSVILALILYIPWIYVLITNFKRFSDTTDWTKIPLGFVGLVKSWIFTFSALFFDIEFGFESIWIDLLRLSLFLLILVAIYKVYRQTGTLTWLFILTSILVPFLTLALPDLLLGGRRSEVSRYLISCCPGVQLAVAYFLASNLRNQQRFSRIALGMLFTISIVSCTASAFIDTSWSKNISYFNADISRNINQEAIANRSLKDTVLISDIGNDFTNMGDMLSLSYLLNKDVKLMLLSQLPDSEMLKKYPAPFVFRPSEKLRSALQKNQRLLEPVLEYAQLFRVRRAP